MKKHFVENKTAYISGLIGVVTFLIIYGVQVINPFYIDFLRVSGDLGQHYFGWELYRISDWFYKIGLMNKASYPYSVSVIFTDSIPLLAVITKILLNGLNVRIQYFGIWELLCFFFQGFVSAKLIEHKVKDEYCVVLGSVVYILSPCMIRRVFWHSALSAHFIILLALLLYECAKEIKTLRYVIYWGLIGFLCASVHLYFVPMCGIILIGSAVYLVWDDNKGLIKALLSTISYVFAAVLMVYVLGGTVSGMDSGAPGIGYYSLNLKSFVSSDDGWSRFLEGIEYYEAGQYEGFVYLGLGTLVLLTVAVLLWFVKIGRDIANRRNGLHNTKTMRSGGYIAGYIFVFVTLLVLAVSNKVAFGKILLFEFAVDDFVEKMWSIVRASGRMAWPMVYIILLLVFSCITDNCEVSKKSLWCARAAIVLCVLLNIADFYPKLYDKHCEYAVTKEYENPVAGAERIIDTFPVKIEHIVFLDKDNLSQDQLYGFADIAADRRISINDFYFARYFMGNVTELADKSAKELHSDCMYVVSEKGFYRMLKYDLRWYEENGVYVGVVKW